MTDERDAEVRFDDWIERDNLMKREEWESAPRRQVEERVMPKVVMDRLAKEFWRAREIISDITGMEGSVGLGGDGHVGMTMGEYRRLAVSLRTERAEIGRLRRWAEEAALALDAATIIGQRAITNGDNLHYGNHDRLLRDASKLLGAPPYRSVPEPANAVPETESTNGA